MRNRIDFSSRDYEGFKHSMLEELKRKMPEYSDYSESDMGIVLIELLSYGLDTLSFYNDIVANERYLPTARERESVIMLTRQLGYTLKEATSSKHYQVFEVIPTEEGTIIPRGYRILTKGTDETLVFETETDLLIPPNCNGLETDENGRYKYLVSVEQGETVYKEILGVSDGGKNQVYAISSPDVLVDSVKVYVSKDGVDREWDRVDNFIDSTREDNHFLVTKDGQGITYVQFGNNISGSIPPKDSDAIKVSYRVGGGSATNVIPNTITELPSKLVNIVSTTNPYGYYVEGTDPEDLELAKVRALGKRRSNKRAVTLRDYEDLTMLVEEVRKVKALEGDYRNSVHLHVLTKREKYISEENAKSIARYFDEKKQIGDDVHVMSPDYVPLTLTAKVKVLDSHDLALVKEEVELAIEHYFNPLNQEFGRNFYKSELIDIISDIRGVRAVILSTNKSDPVVLEDSQLIDLISFNVQVTREVIQSV